MAPSAPILAERRQGYHPSQLFVGGGGRRQLSSGGPSLCLLWADVAPEPGYASDVHRLVEFSRWPYEMPFWVWDRQARPGEHWLLCNSQPVGPGCDPESILTVYGTCTFDQDPGDLVFPTCPRWWTERSKLETSSSARRTVDLWCALERLKSTYWLSREMGAVGEVSSVFSLTSQEVTMEMIMVLWIQNYNSEQEISCLRRQNTEEQQRSCHEKCLLGLRWTNLATWGLNAWSLSTFPKHQC